MKYEIKIPEKVKVGGFDYKIEMGGKVNLDLQADASWGKCANQLRRIRLDDSINSSQLSETFIHEALHAIEDIYVANADEHCISALANGLHQVFEGLGIRFIK